MSRIILASASPRRRELMAQACIHCEIFPAQGDGECLRDTPGEYAMALAGNKAKEILEKTVGPAVIIGADTIVVYGEGDRIGADCRILGKPADRGQACEMLHALQGHRHRVITGVVIYTRGEDGDVKEESFFETTRVIVDPMTDAEIDEYVLSGEADDKAGAYGIQGCFGRYISGIAGDYYNVVGLPIAQLYHRLKRNGALE